MKSFKQTARPAPSKSLAEVRGRVEADAQGDVGQEERAAVGQVLLPVVLIDGVCDGLVVG